MVDVLLLAREHGADRVELAVQGALAAGAHDGRAVARARPPRRAAGRPQPPSLELPEPRLRRPRRPAPDARPTTTSCSAEAPDDRQGEDRRRSRR